MTKTCCVTGHRNLPVEIETIIRPKLHKEVQTAIEGGYTHFIGGFASGVDLMFAEIVVELKNHYPITLEAAIPYTGRLNTPDTEFQRLVGRCDILKVHSERYFKGCFMRRNRYMIDASHQVIAIYDGRGTGGTVATVQYAKRKGLPICMIDIKSIK